MQGVGGAPGVGFIGLSQVLAFSNIWFDEVLFARLFMQTRARLNVLHGGAMYISRMAWSYQAFFNFMRTEICAQKAVSRSSRLTRVMC